MIEINKIEKSDKILDDYNIPKGFTHYILNVASHIRTKNIDKIISAVELLVKKYHVDVCFLNVGSGPLTINLKRMVYRLQLNKNIFFLGAIENRDVLRLMKFSDCFIMSSDDVVFDMVILEALACGTMVLATHCGGNKRLL